ncbi:2-oxo-hept-4-ene-1,7-dioate hydratase [Paracidovorax cattleyae]|uniref:2-oxohept-3-enedioate hydratase n=1 Tax=Paracidovorax cattleyae TaxID=80868 RepID=A0A1H0WB41_9BURK|nr:2-oxo-hepta-3-ene-1,7-dioic acid hydratase [Paracidovorax cattleyae]AVS74913.1 2-oxo-hepta-3-ene-1,7-dioic acid hydratase [Paracidovorax cattleyae]SDP87970.1 2-oxohept-3-enedioate hydratase [Paracidovorax cattleyae]
MLDSEVHLALARELHQAEKSRTQIEQFSRRYPGMTIADSYAIQRAWMAIKREQEGRQVVGHKIGLTSRAMQQASNITEPDYGELLDDMVLETSSEVEAARFIVPRIEVEFAFILGRPLKGPRVSLVDVLRATDYVVPALELIDARIEQVDRATKAPRSVRDTIADNAANAAIVLGGRPMKPDAVDWRWAGALLFKNGVIEESGLGAAVLNHPGTGVAWLANKLAAFDQHLEAGEIVLGGSFTRPVACTPGDTLHADYGPLGSISLRFV